MVSSTIYDSVATIKITAVSLSLIIRQQEIGERPDWVGRHSTAASLSGPQVHNDACLMCHGADTLKQHAFKGHTGYKPPKGWRPGLSDTEIEAAIDYVIGEAQ